MKKSEVAIGGQYKAKVTDKVVTVEILAENPNGGRTPRIWPRAKRSVSNRPSASAGPPPRPPRRHVVRDRRPERSRLPPTPSRPTRPNLGKTRCRSKRPRSSTVPSGSLPRRRSRWRARRWSRPWSRKRTGSRPRVERHRPIRCMRPSLRRSIPRAPSPDSRRSAAASLPSPRNRKRNPNPSLSAKPRHALPGFFSVPPVRFPAKWPHRLLATLHRKKNPFRARPGAGFAWRQIVINSFT